eukprot:scaffold4964_cov33-Tisochrysis_lutea.AAC.1
MSSHDFKKVDLCILIHDVKSNPQQPQATQAKVTEPHARIALVHTQREDNYSGKMRQYVWRRVGGL